MARSIFNSHLYCKSIPKQGIERKDTIRKTEWAPRKAKHQAEYSIKLYGRRIYKRIPKISKKGKLAARSREGYLVGYKASNIFRIWFPKERKVLESRDVEFDEDSKYNPTAPLLEDKLMETTPDQQVTVQIPTYKGDLSQFQPLEDEEDKTPTTLKQLWKKCNNFQRRKPHQVQMNRQAQGKPPSTQRNSQRYRWIKHCERFKNQKTEPIWYNWANQQVYRDM